MIINIKIRSTEVKKLIFAHLKDVLGESFSDQQINNVKIEVKSKQNYRSEWEEADFRVTYTGGTP